MTISIIAIFITPQHKHLLVMEARDRHDDREGWLSSLKAYELRNKFGRGYFAEVLRVLEMAGTDTISDTSERPSPSPSQRLLSSVSMSAFMTPSPRATSHAMAFGDIEKGIPIT